MMNFVYSLMGRAVALLIFTVGPVQAQNAFFFEGRRYFDPLIAGVRDPHISAIIGHSSRFEHQVDPADSRLSWDIDVGAELPLGGWESSPAEGGKVGARQFGFGFWFPIDFHMIEDFVDDSNPIVNTDYRFGLMLKAHYGLAPAKHLAARIQVGHESTHLGDEFSILALRHHPTTFERINVSWEYVDVGLSFERAASSEQTVRVGLTALLGDSYYSTDANSVTSSPIGTVTESSNWFDPYLGVQSQWDQLKSDGFLSRVAGYVSAEVRFRSVYDYHKTTADAVESRKASLNLIAGLKPTGTSDLGRTSIFVRVYRGVNPHGQFRNDEDFTFYGLGMRLVR